MLAAHLAKLALTNLPRLRRDGGKNNRNFYLHTRDIKYSPLKIFRFDATVLTSNNAGSFADSPLNSSLGGNKRSTSEIPVRSAEAKRLAQA